MLIPEFIFFEFTDNVLIPVFNVFTPAVIWFDPCCSLLIPVANSSILVGNAFSLFVFSFSVHKPALICFADEFIFPPT